MGGVACQIMFTFALLARRSLPMEPSIKISLMSHKHTGTPAEFDENGVVKQQTIKPMIDGGTEGLRGHARVIYPGMTPCFECTLWLFPPQVKFPLCTLAETPRSPAHCIEYAHLILWGKVRDEEFDSDKEEHMQWVRYPLWNTSIVLYWSLAMAAI